ncbi:hypothetical protein ACFY7C_11275 [Streptomyces sp. NPDC012769]|uniref:hypothetical protein n=1 Tax=Streptomyces sp. NPDC012769 TaxID=3364848 RepID=UPI0036933406
MCGFTRRAEINGIPCYWDDIPGPFTARLPRDLAGGLDGVLREPAADGPAEEQVRRVERTWSDRLDGDRARFGDGFHEAHEYRPRPFGGGAGRPGRHERMYLADEGLTRWNGCCTDAVRWNQVAGLGIFPSGARRLYGEHGTVIDIQAHWYKSGGDLVAASTPVSPPLFASR